MIGIWILSYHIVAYYNSYYIVTTIGDVKEVRIFGGHLGPHCWPKAIEMVASNRLPLEKIITHTYPLKEFEKGINMVMQSKDSIKVMLIP